MDLGTKEIDSQTAHGYKIPNKYLTKVVITLLQKTGNKPDCSSMITRKTEAKLVNSTSLSCLQRSDCSDQIWRTRVQSGIVSIESRTFQSVKSFVVTTRNWPFNQSTLGAEWCSNHGNRRDVSVIVDCWPSSCNSFNSWHNSTLYTTTYNCKAGGLIYDESVSSCVLRKNY